MFNYPRYNSESFQALRTACSNKNLRLKLAHDYKAYQKMGGNYAAYCKFSGLQITTGECLQEIADFLKIGGVYD